MPDGADCSVAVDKRRAVVSMMNSVNKGIVNRPRRPNMPAASRHEGNPAPRHKSNHIFNEPDEMSQLDAKRNGPLLIVCTVMPRQPSVDPTGTSQLPSINASKSSIINRVLLYGIRGGGATGGEKDGEGISTSPKSGSDKNRRFSGIISSTARVFMSLASGSHKSVTPHPSAPSSSKLQAEARQTEATTAPSAPTTPTPSAGVTFPRKEFHTVTSPTPVPS
jgi:hypothetical protein